MVISEIDKLSFIVNVNSFAIFTHNTQFISLKKKHKNWLAFLGGFDGELYQPSLNQAAMTQCKFKLVPQINTSTNLPMRHSPQPPPEQAQLNSHQTSDHTLVHMY